MIKYLVLSATCLAVASSKYAHFTSAFKSSKSLWTESSLEAAILHDNQLWSDGNRRQMLLSCTPYQNSEKLRDALVDVVGEESFHPVYFSKKDDKACFSLHTTADVSRQISFNDVETMLIPHPVKLDDTIEWTLNYIKSEESTSPITLEIGLGVGVHGKGITSQKTHSEVASDLLANIKNIQTNDDDRLSFVESFFWTSSKTVHHADIAQRNKHMLSTRHIPSCNFDALQITSTSKSHLSITLTLNEKLDYDCFRVIANVASMHPDVSHVAAHASAVALSSAIESEKELDTLYRAVGSIAYQDAVNATDQNAYVQSKTSTESPYSDIGLDGTNYVLGMIDTGLDCLSCFFIDYSGTDTPVTKASQYANPITESYRRKVIQYIAWADGVAQDGKDHGTWCGGASVGKCIYDDDQKANTYNGLAYNSKITMFDVAVNNGDWLDVPSLYNIALPPAYGAGARVHSNSWGTPGMGSYTSKALDVDQFMVENPDFLFVVAAGNDGRSGYTSIHSPGVCKNALTVGASDVDHEEVVYFSGIGYNYDQHMFKPDIIAPGTKVTSAGVRNTNETDSCNVEVLSGTSMATPMAAAASILVRQYFENASFWSEVCNPTYRSCPQVSRLPSGFVSGAFVKAAIIHSGEAMRATSVSSSSVLPAVNLTAPPDRYQGWGQVQLNNLLPLPGQNSYFDLYVADSEVLRSLSKRTYLVNILNSSVPFVVTIAWSDPPNVMWAAKNLLNNLDLIVTSPLGNTSYGNNIYGDDFNPVEKVVIASPYVGVYSIEVLADQLAVGVNQTYSIIVTCGGTVEEVLTTIPPESIDMSIIPVDQETSSCLLKQQETGPAFQLVRFQLEDFNAGTSWKNLSFVVMNGYEEEVFNCSFIPPTESQNSKSSRIYQCAACLEEKVRYTAILNTNSIPLAYQKYVRVASTCDNVFLSQYQQQSTIYAENGQCNPCPEGSSIMGIVMYANVTDDDYKEYTWYGDAYYSVVEAESNSLLAAGTLLVSDEEADRSRYTALIYFLYCTTDMRSCG